MKDDYLSPIPGMESNTCVKSLSGMIHQKMIQNEILFYKIASMNCWHCLKKTVNRQHV